MTSCASKPELKRDMKHGSSKTASTSRNLTVQARTRSIAPLSIANTHFGPSLSNYRIDNLLSPSSILCSPNFASFPLDLTDFQAPACMYASVTTNLPRGLPARSKKRQTGMVQRYRRNSWRDPNNAVRIPPLSTIPIVSPPLSPCTRYSLSRAAATKEKETPTVIECAR
ncbi:hypothetical protein BDV93DRAFT_561935 [Ceratobasidium sp. AG-I]|nr:hypothetical protein BDV93DRAFT_561935 [Ceratobasidium sp. AG-I]